MYSLLKTIHVLVPSLYYQLKWSITFFNVTFCLSLVVLSQMGFRFPADLYENGEIFAEIYNGNNKMWNTGISFVKIV
jgi:hypothetical protein